MAFRLRPYFHRTNVDYTCRRHPWNGLKTFTKKETKQKKQECSGGMHFDFLNIDVSN